MNARCCVIVLGGLLAGLEVAGCKKPENAYVSPPPPAVTVAHPVEHAVTRYIEATGTTEAFESVDLRARVPGFLSEIHFKPGAAVKKDDLLFVIDKRTYQATADRAAAQVLADEATYKAAVADARIAEELFSQRAGSEIDKLLKVGRRDSAKAQIAASEAALATAKLDLEFCEVRAPISGRITKNLVDVGNLVGAGGQATVLATMVSSRPIYVTLDASESDLMLARRARLEAAPNTVPGEVAPGQWRPVMLATAESNVFDIAGQIDYVDPAINALTGTIRVRCRFENEQDLLLPGMFVRARVLLDTKPAVLAPDIALLSDQSGRYALVVNEKDMVEAVQVKVGTLDGSMRVVESGLSPTDRIVVNGLQRARPGIKVAPTLAELTSTTRSTTSTATALSTTRPN